MRVLIRTSKFIAGLSTVCYKGVNARALYCCRVLDRYAKTDGEYCYLVRTINRITTDDGSIAEHIAKVF